MDIHNDRVIFKFLFAIAAFFIILVAALVSFKYDVKAGVAVLWFGAMAYLTIFCVAWLAAGRVSPISTKSATSIVIGIVSNHITFNLFSALIVGCFMALSFIGWTFISNILPVDAPDQTVAASLVQGVP